MMSLFMDLDDRAICCRDYALALEEERRKIMVFHRELPLSLQLVTHAIESCKQQIGGDQDAKRDCSPVLEEFLSLKPASSWSEESHRNDDKSVEEEMVLDKTPDWLRSVQLRNQDTDPLPKGVLVRKPVAVNVRKLRGAFQPFEKEKHVPIETDGTAPAVSSTVDATTASLGGTAVVDTENDMEGHSQSQSHRKSRRCWSHELHRRFLQALQQLGGSHTATPKQIRELMKVDGLTNDEVKSHLQKYRLHTRRPTPTVQSNNNSSPQAPHFVVVGGIWVPPPEYAAAAAAAAAQPSEVADAPFNGVYAPVASLPSECISQHRQQRKQSNQSSHNGPLHSVVRCSSSLADDGATNILSPNSSSSKTVTTSSPAMIRGEEL